MGGGNEWRNREGWKLNGGGNSVEVQANYGITEGFLGMGSA